MAYQILSISDGRYFKEKYKEKNVQYVHNTIQKYFGYNSKFLTINEKQQIFTCLEITSTSEGQDIISIDYYTHLKQILYVDIYPGDDNYYIIQLIATIKNPNNIYSSQKCFYLMCDQIYEIISLMEYIHAIDFAAQIDGLFPIDILDNNFLNENILYLK